MFKVAIFQVIFWILIDNQDWQKKCHLAAGDNFSKLYICLLTFWMNSFFGSMWSELRQVRSDIRHSQHLAASVLMLMLMRPVVSGEGTSNVKQLPDRWRILLFAECKFWQVWQLIVKIIWEGGVGLYDSSLQANSKNLGIRHLLLSYTWQFIWISFCPSVCRNLFAQYRKTISTDHWSCWFVFLLVHQVKLRMQALLYIWTWAELLILSFTIL